MKQYLLFAGHHKYPSGGWQDFIDSFDSLVDAVNVGQEMLAPHSLREWFHVVDRQVGKIIHTGHLTCRGDLIVRSWRGAP